MTSIPFRCILQPRLEMLPEKSNENLYDTITPKPSSIKTKHLNVSLFTRVKDILDSREDINNIYKNVGGESETDNYVFSDNLHACQINPRNHTSSSVQKTKVKTMTLELPPHKRCNTILKRLKYYNRLCDMANILRYIHYYFNNDIPIFRYKAFQFIGSGPFIFMAGHSKYLDDFQKFNVFEQDNEQFQNENIYDSPSELSGHTYDITKSGIFIIYRYLLNYVMIRTIHNYPILVYKDFVWYESYIYMRTIPLQYILASRISHGPISCKMCKEYAHPTLKIFQNYCEFCFKEIKEDIKEYYEDSYSDNE